MSDSNATELLPCPICGGQPDFQHFNITPNVKGRIICACGISLVQGKNDTDDDMRIIWNTRTERTCHAESDLSEWVCSECQCWIPLGLTPENIKHASEWRYCPHCGAKVVGGKAVKR